jgi:hypothetical protein
MTMRPAATSSRTACARPGNSAFEVRFALGDSLHLRGDDAEAGELELGDRLELRG